MHSKYPAAIILGTGPIGDEDPYFVCSICDNEILSSDPSAVHAHCGKGAFHQECLDNWIEDNPLCPACSDPFMLGRANTGTQTFRKRKPAATKSQPPLAPHASSSSVESQSSSSESDTVWYSPDPFKERNPTPEPESVQEDTTTTTPCTFRPTEGLMSLILSHQASVQSLTGHEVWTLPLNPRDKKQALRLSPTLTGFSRIYYHAPGTARDESTLFLSHPKFQPGSSPSPRTASPTAERHSSYRDALTVDAKAEIDRLSDMIQGWRTSSRTEAETAGQFVSPPTVCGYVTIDGRRAKIVTGIVWLKPGEKEKDLKNTNNKPK